MGENELHNSGNFISLAEASKQTGYHQDYLGFLCRSGKLEGFKIGRNWVTTQEALDNFVAKIAEEKAGVAGEQSVEAVQPVVESRVALQAEQQEPAHEQDTHEFLKAIHETIIPEEESYKVAVHNATAPLNSLKADVLRNLEIRVSTLHKNLDSLEKKLEQQEAQQAKVINVPAQVEVAVTPKNELKHKFASTIPLHQAAEEEVQALTPSNIKKLYQSFVSKPVFGAGLAWAMTFIATVVLGGAATWMYLSDPNAGQSPAVTKVVYQRGEGRGQREDNKPNLIQQPAVTNPSTQTVVVREQVRTESVVKAVEADASLLNVLIDQRLNAYLAEGKFKGEKGDRGEAGSAGAMVSYVQPSSTSSGTGSLLGVTYLSAQDFITSKLTATGDSTLGGKLSVAGSTALGGELSVAGGMSVSGNTTLATTSLSSLTVGGDTVFNGSVALNGSTTIANLTVTGINPNLTPGSVVFQNASGLAEDNANFHWDYVNRRLGIGTSTPSQLLTVGNNNQFTVSSGGNVTGNIFQGQFRGAMWGDGNAYAGIMQGTSVAGNRANLLFSNTNGTDFTSLQFGAISANFPGIVISTSTAPYGVAIRIRTADNTADATLTAGTILASGNIGIGTTTPTARLNVYNSVVGVSSFRINGPGAGDNLQEWLLNDGTWVGYVAAWGMGLKSGSFGGNANIGGQYKANLLASDANGAYLHQTGDTGNVVNQFRANGNSYITGGNVGIGTTSPAAKLDVSGILRVFDQTAGTGVSGLVIKSGAGQSTNKWIDIQNEGGASPFQVTPTSSYGGGSGASLFVSHGITTTGTFTGEQLRLTSSYFDHQPLRVTGAPGQTASLAEYVNASGTVISNVTASGGAYFASNVGIGTASPTAKLEVSGNFKVNNNGAGNDIQIFSDSFIGRSAGLFNFISPAPISLQVAGAERARLDTNGNFGIGTTTPTERLSVAGNGYFGGNLTATGSLNVTGTGSHTIDRIQISRPGADAQIQSTNGYLKLGGAGANDVFMLTNVMMNNNSRIGTNLGNFTINAGVNEASQVSSIIFQSRGSELMRIAASGNVGVGIANPTQGRLAVQVSADDSYALSVHNTAGTQIGGLFSASNSGQLYLKDSGSNTQVRLAADGSSSFINVGNVGIGTTDPQQKLHVNGAIRMDSNSLQMNGAYQALFGVAGTRLQIGDDYSNITIAGNVGIGTSSPSSKLDVWGNLNVATGSAPALFVNTGTGNIGIGTNNPTDRLEIASGNVKLPYSSLIYFGATGATISGHGTGNYLDFSTGGSNSMRIINGNVGIGTTTPDRSLSVAGSGLFRLGGGAAVTIDGDDTNARGLILNRLGSARWSIGRGGADGFLGFYDYRKSGGAGYQMVISDVSGNVGIGTTSPQAKLDVNGSFRVNNGAIDYSDVTGITSIDNLQLGNLTFDTDAGQVSWADLLVTASSTVGTINSYTAQIDGQPLLTVYSESDGAGSVTSTGIGIGTTTPAARLSLQGSAGSAALLSVTSSTGTSLFHIAGNGNVGIGTSSPAAKLDVWGNMSVATGSTSTLFVDTSSGRVGIGKNNPGFALDVAGHISAGTSNVMGSWATFSRFNTVGNTYYLAPAGSGGISGILAENVGIGTTTPVARLSVTGASIVDPFNISSTSGTSFVRVTAAGNVGIGTTTPGASLTIGSGQVLLPDGSLSTPSLSFNSNPDTGIFYQNDAIQFSFNGFGRGYWSNSIIAVPDTVRWDVDSSMSIRRLAVDTMAFQTNGNANMVINPLGNVGIGTTAPSSLLFVQNMNSGSTTPLLTVASSTGSTLFTVNASGSVGIGTANPGVNYALDVNGDIRSNGNIMAGWGNYLYFGDTTTGIQGDGSTDTIAFKTNANFRMSITSDGNVGIGTTSPQQKLEVNGNLRLSNNSNYVEFINGTKILYNRLYSSGVDYSLSSWNGSQEINNLTIKASNGFVGIGTTTPSHKLTVAGDINFTGNLYQNGVQFGGGSGNGTVATSSAGQIAYFPADGNLVQGQSSLYYSGGNVGVGTTNPVSALAVNGTLTVATGIAGNALYYHNPSQGTFSVDNNANISGRSLNTSIAITQGNVWTVNSSFQRMANNYTLGWMSGSAIGGNNDIALGRNAAGVLEVNNGTSGNLAGLVANTISIGTSTLPTNGSLAVIGNVGIGTTTPDYKMVVNGVIAPNANTAGGLGAPGRYWGQSYIFGIDMGWGSIAAVSTIYSDNDIDLSLYSGAGRTLKLGSNNTQGQMVISNGNVGIGTTSPSAQLQISIATSTAKGLIIQAASSQSAYIQEWQNSAGSTLAQVDKDGIFRSGGSALGYNSVVSGYLGVNNYSGVASYFAGSLSVGTTTAPTNGVMAINGNVGIGTTSPTTKLDVNGTTIIRNVLQLGAEDVGLSRVSAGLLAVGDGTAGNTSGTLRASELIGSSYLTLGGTSGVLRFWGGLTNDAGISRIGTSTLAVGNGTSGNTSGTLVASRIGIGTTAPAATLYVQATSTGNVFTVASSTGASYFSIDNAGTLNTPGGTQWFYNGNINMNGRTISNLTSVMGSNAAGYNLSVGTNNATGNLILQAGAGSEYMRITDAGNVGIGTTAPSSLLFVQNMSSGSTTPLLTVASSTGSSLFTVNADGRVGIGTADPAALLHVKGGTALNTTLRVESGENYKSALRLYSGTGGGIYAWELGFDSNAANGALVFDDFGDTGNVVFDIDGNVGIGTTSPSQSLDVNGNIAVQGSYIYGDSTTPRVRLSNGTGSFLSYGSGTYYQAGSNILRLFTNSSERLTVDSSGNVGIGTTSPIAPLQIGSASGQNILFNQNTDTLTDFRWSGDARVRITTNAYSSFGSAYDADGSGANGAGGIRLGNGSVGYSYVVGGPNLLLQPVTGNVGIGTTTPFAKLTVGDATGQNTVRVNGSNGVDMAPVVSLFRRSAAEWVLAASGNSNGDFSIGLDPASYSNSHLAAAAKFTIRNSGNVGIGTTAPSTKLHVAGATYSSSGFWVNGSDLVNTTNNSPWYGIGNANFTLPGGDNTATQLAGYGGLNFQTASGRMVLLQNGNVGIGTTSPSQLLEVSGNNPKIRLTNTAAGGVTADLFAGTSGITLGTVGAPSAFTITSDAVAGGLTVNSAGISVAGSITSGNDLLIRSSTSGTAGKSVKFQSWNGSAWQTLVNFANVASGNVDLALAENGGNVGIGTTSPQEKLHVYGSGIQRFEIESSDNSTVAQKITNPTGSYGWYIPGGDNKFSLYDYGASTDRITVNSVGNIGIGTTSPSQLLTVGNNNQFTVSGTGVVTALNIYANFLGGVHASYVAPRTAGSDLTFTNYSGSEKMRITDAGNVGIGTTSPQSKLDVNGAITLRANNGQILFNPNSVSGRNAILQTSSGLSSNYNGIWLASNETTNFTQGTTSLWSWALDLGGFDSLTNANTRDAFTILRKPAAGSYSSVFTINNNGNVGIGTTSISSTVTIQGMEGPSPLLTISSSSGASMFAVSGGGIVTAAGSISGGGHFTISANSAAFRLRGGNSVISSPAEGKILFSNSSFSGNATIVAGSLGLGSATPDSLLSIQGTSTNPTLPLLTIASSSGASILRIASDGNVGIGTTTPESKLVIQGTAGDVNSIFTIASSAGQSLLSVAPNGTVSVGANATLDTNLNIYSDTQNSFFQINSSGNFGGINAFGLYNMLFSNYYNNNGRISFNTQTGGSSYTRLFIDNNGDVGIGGSMTSGSMSLASSTMSVLANGNVGIGTTTPQARLHVLGSAGASPLIVSSSSGSTILSVSPEGKIGLMTDSPASYVTNRSVVFASDLFGDGLFLTNSFSAAYLDLSTNAFDFAPDDAGPSKFTVWNSIDFQEEVFRIDTVNGGNGSTTITGQGIVRAKNNATDTFQVQNASKVAVLSVDTSNQRVGIGTTTPDKKLSVSGDINFTGNLYQNGVQVALGGSSQWSNVAGGIHYSSGNVGIGTTTPDEYLSLYSTGQTNLSIRTSHTNNYASLKLQAGGNTWPAQIFQAGSSFSAYGGAGSLNIIPANGPLWVGSGAGTTYMLIGTNGNVGIGTTSPAAKLNIYSTTAQDSLMVRSNNGSVWRIDQWGNFIGPGVNMGWDTNINANGYSSYGDTYITSGKSGSTDYNIILKPSGAGSVGIGTTSPQYQLDVWGSSRVHVGTAQNLVVNSRGSNVNLLAANDDVSGAIGISIQATTLNVLNGSGNASRLYIDTNGNVGIGTTAPSQLLTVGNDNQFTVSSAGLMSAQTTIIGATTTNPIVVTGNGNSPGGSPNGTYVYAGQYNGSNYYQLGNSWYIWYNGSNRWYISNALGSTANSWNIYFVSQNIWLGGGWNGSGSYTGISSTAYGTGAYLLVDGGGNITTGGTLAVQSTSTSYILGNVGIGTTSPSNKLHIYSDTASGLKIERSTASNNSNIQYTNPGGSMYAGLSGSSDFGIGSSVDLATAYLTVLKTGNVGIGTTSPQAALHVKSNTDQNALTLNTFHGQTVSFNSWGYLNASGISTQYETYWDGGAGFIAGDGGGSTNIGSNNNQNIVLYPQGTGNVLVRSGNVGIGTTNPASTLTLRGKSGVEPLTIASSSGATLLNLTQAGGLGIGQAPGGFKLAVAGDIYTSSNIFSTYLYTGTGGGVGLNSQVQLKPGGQGNLTLYNNANTDFNLLQFGGTTSGFAALQAASSTNPSGVSLKVVAADGVSNANFYVTGNVGIGTMEPGYKLHIDGEMKAGGYYIQSTETSIMNESNRLALKGSAGISFFPDYSSQWDEKMRILENGNVGIGTTTPEATLMVQGVGSTNPFQIVSASGTSLISVLSNGNLSMTPGSNLSFTGTSRIQGGGTAPNDYLNFYTNNTSRFYIAGTGNVGIGTTAPSQLLTVGNNNQFTVASSGIATAVQYRGAGAYNKLAPQFSDAAGVTGMSINNNGAFFSANNSSIFAFDMTGGLVLTSNYVMGWAPGFADASYNDTGFSRLAANKIGVGNGTSGNTSGTLIAGNVGIGTTSPDAPLTVKGYYTNPLAPAGIHMQGDIPGISFEDSTISGSHRNFAILNNYSSPGLLEFNYSSSGGGSPTVNAFKIDGTTGSTLFTGNVGIGTTSPAQKLQVVGNAVIGTSNTAGTLYLGGDQNISLTRNSYELTMSSAGNLNLVYDSDASAPTEVLTIKRGSTAVLTADSNGNIGIGTTSPSQLLTVGNNNQFSVASNGNVDANLYQIGGVSVVYSSGGNKYLRAGSGTGAGIQVNANTTALFATSAGNVGIGTTSPANKLHVAGITQTDALWVTGGSTASVIGVNTVEQYNASVNLTIRTAAGTNKHINLMPNGTGNVGIGVSNPGEKLEVGGNVFVNSFESSLYFQGGTRVGFQPASQHWGLYTAQNDMHLMTYDGSNVQSRLVINAANGNVGIGTTTPSGKLMVYGSNTTDTISARSGANNTYAAYSLGRTAAESYWGVAGQPSDWALGTVAGDTVLTTANSGKLHLSARTVPSTANIVLDTNGNVGIGTTGPSGIFEVFPAGAGRTRGALVVNDRDVTVGVLSGTAGDNSKFNVVARGGTSYLMVDTNNGYSYFQNGNVGIGTTSPGAKLDVYGGDIWQTTSNSNYYLKTDVNASGADAINFIGPYAQNFLQFDSLAGGYQTTLGTSGAGDTTIISGNVGIGTTTPDKKLSVAGDINFTGNLYQNGVQVALGGSSQWSNVASGIHYSSGNVGIGTNNPGALLTVKGDTNAFAVGPLVVTASSTNSVGTALTLDATASTGGRKYSFLSTGPGASFGAGAWAIYDGTNSAYRLVIDTAGNLNFNPGNTQNTSSLNPQLRYFHAGALASYGSDFGYLAETDRYRVRTFVPSNGDISFASHPFGSVPSTQGGYTERMVIRGDSGNVGIGTSSPSAKFDVYSTTATDAFAVRSNDGSRWNINQWGGLTSTFGAAIGFDPNISTHAFSWLAGDMKITSGMGSTDPFNIILKPSGTGNIQLNGNVGIGTTTPGQALVVNGQVQLTGGSPAAGKVLLSDANGVGSWVATSTLGLGGGSLSGGTAGKTAIWSAADALTSGLLLDNGSVAGVNATSSSYTFTVQGSSGTHPFQVASATGASLFAVTAAGTVSLPATTAAGAGVVNLNGSRFLHAAGTNSVFLGREAGSLTNTGSGNYALGYQALDALTNGSDNIAVGLTALTSLQNGAGNIALGLDALSDLTSGTSNVAIGNRSLDNMNGTLNVAVGYITGRQLDSTSEKNVILGAGALYGNFGVVNNTVAVGYNAGTAITSGDNNTLLGYQAGDNLTTGSNNIVIGYDIDARANNSANTLNIGNLLFGTGLDGTGTTISSGSIGIGTSSPVARLAVAGRAGANDVLEVASSSGASFLRVTASGNVGINTTSPTEMLHLVKNDDVRIMIDSYGSTSVNPSVVGRQAGGTVTSPSATQDASILLSLSARGYGTTGFSSGARANILFVSSQTWTDSAQGANIRFETTPNNSTTRSERMRIGSDGNVGIGTTSPAAKLHIGSVASGGNVRVANGWLCVDNNDTCTGATTAGTVYAVGAYTTGADVAENYPTKDMDLAPGEAVALAADGLYVTRATTTAKAFGIVSTKPGVLLAGHNADQFEGATTVPVALAGRVPMKVTNENGNIEPGDYLTLSKRFPGYAMKATASGHVLGQALERFASASSGDSSTILVFVQMGWQNVNNTFILGEGELSGQLASSSVASFIINQKGSGNMLQVQKDGMDRFVIDNSGAMSILATTTETTDLVVVTNNSERKFTINSRGDLFAAGHITVGKDTAGTATIKAGDNQVTVTFSFPYTGVPKVIVTAQGLPNFFYGVTEKTETGFTITADRPVTEDMSFDWVALIQSEPTQFTSSQSMRVLSAPAPVESAQADEGQVAGETVVSDAAPAATEPEVPAAPEPAAEPAATNPEPALPPVSQAE